MLEEHCISDVSIAKMIVLPKGYFLRDKRRFNIFDKLFGFGRLSSFGRSSMSSETITMEDDYESSEVLIMSYILKIVSG